MNINLWSCCMYYPACYVLFIHASALMVGYRCLTSVDTPRRLLWHLCTPVSCKRPYSSLLRRWALNNVATYGTPACIPTLGQLQSDPSFMSRMAGETRSDNSTDLDMVQTGSADKASHAIQILHVACCMQLLRMMSPVHGFASHVPSNFGPRVLNVLDMRLDSPLEAGILCER